MNDGDSHTPGSGDPGDGALTENGGDDIKSGDASEKKTPARSVSASRRGVIGALTAFGVGTYLASEPASAVEVHDHLNEDWSGDPGGRGLDLEMGTNTDVAVFGSSSSSSARALKGHATAGSGTTIGVEGKAESPDSVALLGNATATGGNAKGLEGRSAAEFGIGVVGNAKHDSGSTKGVRGLSHSPDGRGVEGVNTAASGTTHGVRGQVDSPDGYGLSTPDDANVGGELTVGDGLSVDPVEIGAGASADDTGTVIGPNSVAPQNSVIIGEGIDASGKNESVVIGSPTDTGGERDVTIGFGSDGTKDGVTIGHNTTSGYATVTIGKNASSPGQNETVTIGHNASGANRNSVAIGSHTNENGTSKNNGWNGIRVAIGSRASANDEGTAIGPGAGEWGTPGSNVVNIGNETSVAGDYAIGIGDQSDIGTGGNGEPMIKSGANGSVALGTSVEVKTSNVARIGMSRTSNPSPRQLVWQGVEQLSNTDYVENEVTLYMDETNGQFVIKGKDSDGNIRTSTIPW